MIDTIIKKFVSWKRGRLIGSFLSLHGASLSLQFRRGRRREHTALGDLLIV